MLFIKADLYIKRYIFYLIKIEEIFAFQLVNNLVMNDKRLIIVLKGLFQIQNTICY